MAARYVAFLRAINVGGRVVKMTELKRIFESLRLADVETFIASGNVIFSSAAKDVAKLERQIEKGLQAALGYSVTTFLRTTSEVSTVAKYEPFAESAMDESTLYIAFLQGRPSKDAVSKLMTLRTPADDFHVNGREFYWLCRTKLMDSKFSGANLEKILAMPATLRNVNTIRRLADKWDR